MIDLAFQISWLIAAALMAWLSYKKIGSGTRIPAAFMAALIITIPLVISSVYADNRPPNVQGLPDVSFYENSEELDLKDYVIDPDNTNEQLVWSINSSGTQISASISSSDILVFSISPSADVTEIFTLTATDPGGLKGSDVISVKSSGFVDGGEACSSQLTDSNLIMIDLGESASAIEQIVYVFYAICMTISAIEFIITVLNTIWPGSFDRPPCNLPAYAQPICKGIDVIDEVMGKVYGATKYFCCFITCGWCSSYSKESQVTGAPSTSKSSAGCPAPYGIMNWATEMAGVSIDPFENIYTAMACMCPVAILMNLRKMRTVYSVYECCVEQACERGIDKQVCEDYLKEAECMYLEAAWQKTLINVLLRIIIPKVMASLIADELIAEAQPYTSWIQLIAVPLTISGLIDIWSFVMKTFEEPSGEECQQKFQEYFDDPGLVPGYGSRPEVNFDWDKWDKNQDGTFSMKISTGETLKYDPDTKKYTTIRLPDNKIIESEVLITDAQKAENNRRIAEYAVNKLLEFALDNWAYPIIDEQCEAETESSRPQSDGPVANIVSQSLSDIYNCNMDKNTKIQASGTISKKETSLYVVDASYSITHCNSTLGALTYTVYAVSTGGSKDQIKVATMLFDDSHAGNFQRNYSSNYSTISIKTDDPEIGEISFELTPQ